MIRNRGSLSVLWVLLAGLLFLASAVAADDGFITVSGGFSSKYTAESRAVLWDNGPLVTTPGGGAGGADISELQTTLGMNTLGGGCQISVDNRMADDFDVAQTWNIDSVTLFAYQTESGTTSTINEARIQIWDGPPNAGGTVVWGDLVTNRMTGTGWTSIYRVTDTTQTAVNRPIMYVDCDVATTLAPGTYWLEWTIGGTLASGPWQPPITILGQTTTGNAIQYTSSTSAWAPFNDTGTLTQQGVPFVINGDLAGMWVIDFDGLSSGTPVGTNYPGVTFSPGWTTWDPGSSPSFPPHSSPNVAYTWEQDNTIIWDCSLNYLSFYVNCYNYTGTMMWEYMVYDSGGSYLGSYTINSTVLNEFVEFTFPDMRRLEVRGVEGWYEYHTIDDIIYACNEMPTATPTAVVTPTSTPTPSTCDVLWDQPLSTVNTNAYVSQEFSDYPTYSAYLADDFTNTETWTIQEIFAPGGLWNGSGVMTLMNASALTWQLYADNAGLPDGDPSGGGNPPVWSLTLLPTDPQVTISTGSGGLPSDTSVTLASPLSIPPGTWWFVFYPTMEFATAGQFGLQPSDTTNLSIGQWINPGGGFGYGTAWQNWTVLGATQQDVAFRLCGEIAGAPTNTPTGVPPTNTPTRTPTSVPPTNTPTLTPTGVPPTNTPTRTPTNTPTGAPTNTPTRTPTLTPTPTVPTSTPTWTPGPGTPTDTPTMTPTQGPTDTPTGEPTETPVPPTETPACTTMGCTVYMPSSDFGAGDECYCDVYVCNTDSTTYTDIPVFVILDVYGMYFFAPTFGSFDYYDDPIPPGLTTIHVLPSFPWPAGAGAASNIVWYAAMTNPQMSALHGDLGTFTFGWH